MQTTYTQATAQQAALWHANIATINAGGLCPQNAGVASGMAAMQAAHPQGAVLASWLRNHYTAQLRYGWAVAAVTGNAGVAVHTLPRPVRGAVRTAAHALLG